MSDGPVIVQQAAQIRALKRIGALLAAERNCYIDAYLDLEEKAEQLIAIIHQERAKAEALEADLSRCREMRSKLWQRVKELKTSQSKGD